MNDKKVSWWRYPVSVVALWALVLFGGAILLLWNALSPRMMRYEQGDLGYSILQIACGPFGLWLGHKAMIALTGGRASQFSVINCVVVAVVFFCFLALSLITRTAQLEGALSYIATAAAAIVLAVLDNREVRAGYGQNT